ncbi:unnamed protein product [Caenorhabditis angaria]|uniref:Uncharacterized protein n=1 Tax=Caenorhabditis angaria TaxID=860376 RepID=A0A9P1IYN6_9PELO|nr:unnamed protein product [Caenorhabditis angaria]
MSRFSGKVVIVTGSSNGIGRSAAILFAKDGAKITISGRNAERLEETKKLILSQGICPENINSVLGDITKSEDQKILIDSTLQKFGGKIDILVNNAGAAMPDTTGVSGVESDISNFERNLAVNLNSVIGLVQKAKPYLEKSKGDIVNVSSIASGPAAHVGAMYYSMAKAALDQFTRNVAIELIASGVRVNCVRPGVVTTGFMQAMGATEQASDEFYKLFGSRKDCVPAGRLGTPEDISHLILFLADRKSSFYIIGQVITIDGGSSLMNVLASSFET